MAFSLPNYINIWTNGKRKYIEMLIQLIVCCCSCNACGYVSDDGAQNPFQRLGAGINRAGSVIREITRLMIVRRKLLLYVGSKPCPRLIVPHVPKEAKV
jgi:hypothetical protein